MFYMYFIDVHFMDKVLNSAELYWGPLSVISCVGMLWSAKMLLRLLITADDVVLVSFLMTGNLLY